MRIAVDGEHHVAVAGHIGVIAIDQALGDLDDLGDVLGRARLLIRAVDQQRVEVGVHFRQHAFGQLVAGFMIFRRAADDFVVHVGDVAHVVQRIAEVAQVTRHHVESDKGTTVADVTQVIDGYPAHVHAHFPGMNGFEFLF